MIQCRKKELKIHAKTKVAYLQAVDGFTNPNLGVGQYPVRANFALAA